MPYLTLKGIKKFSIRSQPLPKLNKILIKWIVMRISLGRWSRKKNSSFRKYKKEKNFTKKTMLMWMNQTMTPKFSRKKSITWGKPSLTESFNKKLRAFIHQINWRLLSTIQRPRTAFITKKMNKKIKKRSRNMSLYLRFKLSQSAIWINLKTQRRKNINK